MKRTRAEKLLKKIERDLCRGSTFHYHSKDVRSLNRALDKVCDANGKAIDEIRSYFTDNPEGNAK
jgi:hypothetical protein